MTSISERLVPPSSSVDTSTPSAAVVPKLLSVEISTLDQHGDPGFVHTRGHFYTHSTAARFAISQAEVVAALREVDELAVTVTRQGEGYSETDAVVVGTAGEIACALATMPDYAGGVRSAELSAPEYVLAAVATVTAARPPLVDDDCDLGGVLEVRVRSVRPDPLPDSTTVLGDYPAAAARQVAGEVVDHITADAPGRIEGAVSEIDVRSMLLVAHSVDLSDTDAAAVERYGQIMRLRANLSGLDCVVDADEVRELTAQLHRMFAHNVRCGARVAVDGRQS